jgi:hypothetical protein
MEIGIESQTCLFITCLNMSIREAEGKTLPPSRTRPMQEIF